MPDDKPEIETGQCAECGADVARELPETERARSFLKAIPFVCPDCVAEAEEEQAVHERRRETEETARLLAARKRRSGIEEHLAGFTFGQIDRRPGLEAAIDLAQRWAKGSVNGALLFGPVGVGKTRVAIAAANEMLAKKALRFVSAPLLLARLGSGGFDSPQRQEALEVLTGTLPLVIDDIDKARPTNYAAEQIFLAVDARADGAAPLLVTTNMRLGEMGERWPEPYGEAIASRLSLLEVAKAEGEDRRTQR